ncbi:hypothetical protein GGI20_000775 [Coemansia sp. BCRC 34301]|nr:hypothetical protein GGI20_000775 [Coemansia sp. BCRC 34301]
MGTLGNQLAYVYYLGIEAATPSIRRWTPEHLTTDVLVWSQHIDLIWPTLCNSDQRLVAIHAARLSANPCAEAMPANWQKFILGRVICNRHTPHPVRVAALHHYAELLRSKKLESGESASAVINVGARVAAELEPMRKQRALADLMAVFGRELECRVADRGTVVGSERLHMEADYYLDKASLVRRGVAVGLALIGLAQHSNDIAGLVSAIFYQQTGDMLNGLLFAACHIYEQHGASSQLSEFQSAAMREFDTRILHLCDIDRKLSLITQLDPWPLARLSELEEWFGRAYMSQLTQLNKRCQMAMLADFIFGQDAADKESDDVASSEATVSKVVEKWQHLFVQPSCVVLVREALGRDFARFQGLLGKKRVDSSAVYDVIVGVWLAFYNQFLE